MGINLVPTEISNIYNPILAEVFFAIIGLVFIATGIKAFRDSATAKHITKTSLSSGVFLCQKGGVIFINKPIKARDKITQKMSRDGLTEQNQTTGESELISKRIQDADFQKTPEQQAAQDAAQLQGAVSPSSPLPHAQELFSKPQDAAAERVMELTSILLDNAIRHSSNGKNVTLTLKEEKNNAILFVVNDGEEIPPEQKQYLFERFYLTDTARTGEDNHYGLGLAIAKAITNAHKGTINVRCYEGKVEFLVKLPLQNRNRKN